MASDEDVMVISDSEDNSDESYEEYNDYSDDITHKLVEAVDGVLATLEKHFDSEEPAVPVDIVYLEKVKVDFEPALKLPLMYDYRREKGTNDSYRYNVGGKWYHNHRELHKALPGVRAQYPNLSHRNFCFDQVMTKYCEQKFNRTVDKPGHIALRTDPNGAFGKSTDADKVVFTWLDDPKDKPHVVEMVKFLNENYLTDYIGQTNNETEVCCNCTDGCVSSSCACRQKTLERATKYNRTIEENAQWSSEQKRINPVNMYGWSIAGKLVNEEKYLYNVPSGIFECHAGCGCKKTCVNKVTQSGVQYHLDVHHSTKSNANGTYTGWSMYARETIPVGSFVCLYLGELVDSEVNKVNVNEAVEQELRQGESWESKDHWIFYFDNKTFDLKHDDINTTSLDISMCPMTEEPNNYMVVNAFHKGNIARFANHRCGDYNMLKQPVYRRSHSNKHYYLALVTKECVTPKLQLTWDYGYSDKDLKNFLKCCCDTEACPNGLTL